MVRRIYVWKKEGFDIEAQGIYADLKKNLGIPGIEGISLLCRYDVEGLSDAQYELAKNIVFSEPPVDECSDEVMPPVNGNRFFAMEYLPGQYDQRADSAMQCIQILTCGERPRVKSAKVIVCKGNLTDETFQKIKEYLINPVDSREAALEKPQTLEEALTIPENVPVCEGFITCTEEELEQRRKELGLAMDHADILFCRDYFKNQEKRDPTMTEIRMIDTYWSDHCRHTTFLTQLEEVNFEDGVAADTMRAAWNRYLKDRQEVYGEKKKDICLMDVALMAVKKLKKDGKMHGLDESEEINACSVEVDAQVNGKTEKWLVMFKNETHNHPTEIEPFGGAATCLGGAIRDPLSGRSYVYQAMRVTGSGDPRTSVKDTISGKLPQRKITTGAAAGYSSYGNQIGLATGQVDEVYHEGYVAKRLEIGAVVGAVPKEQVRRERPAPGDVVILLGGKTGRDGCGGATGSSKAHTLQSLENCGAEVQKGNPPEERTIQRLFRKPQVTKLIKRCNDFGAGGVSVAIGELADGLFINLDAVPKKYEGLDGTELAISESQERMAVVVASEDAKDFMQLAAEENLEATLVATVKEEPRLEMKWRENTIVNVSREFLNSNGAKKKAKATVQAVKPYEPVKDIKSAQQWYECLGSLQECSRKGLSERFDSTIGAGTVLMPFGGKYQLTPPEAMAAKLPVLEGDTTTGTLMSYGFQPDLSQWSPFHGAMYAVVESVSKLVAAGGDYRKAYLTFQEYFERLYEEPHRWGKPLSALLGAYQAQLELGIGSIGGKDSMSGSFNDLDVPPTLVSFAICVNDVRNTLSPEFKTAGSPVIYIETGKKEDETVDFEKLKSNFELVQTLIAQGKVRSAATVKGGGIAPVIAKMCFGNGVGIAFEDSFDVNLFEQGYGSFILELKEPVQEGMLLGYTIEEQEIRVAGNVIDLKKLREAWENPLETVFPTKAPAGDGKAVRRPSFSQHCAILPKGIAKPKVFIPVFPGTNCEYDTAKAFEREGAQTEIFVIRNQTSGEIEQSLSQMAERISKAQIVMLPGGFSGGDEPEGSGKFIAAAFRNPFVKEAVHKLLKERDGLMLGICNGFQALIKLGLVPYGEIVDLKEDAPTLTFNNIGRHASCLVRTRVASVKSPWMSECSVDDTYTIAISHGEGKFVCGQELYRRLEQNGQIATQYVNLDGEPTYDIAFNPNGSYQAVEGITSPDGRVFGKMGHSERSGENLYKNVDGNKMQPIFQSGVRYFK